jgi:hypothetical protein
MAKSPTNTSRWDLSNWTPGNVTLFQALGISKGTIQYPQLTTKLTAPAANASGSSSTSSSSGDSGTQPTASGACNAAQTASNKSLGQQLATTFGWGSGPQFDDLNNIVMAESGWCNTIQNPGSTAYGIGQFLNTTWASTGYTKTSSPKIQILAMLAYIKMRYGSPANAWMFHQANGYY